MVGWQQWYATRRTLRSHWCTHPERRQHLGCSNGHWRRRQVSGYPAASDPCHREGRPTGAHHPRWHWEGRLPTQRDCCHGIAAMHQAPWLAPEATGDGTHAARPGRAHGMGEAEQAAAEALCHKPVMGQSDALARTREARVRTDSRRHSTRRAPSDHDENAEKRPPLAMARGCQKAVGRCLRGHKAGRSSQ